MTKPQIILDRLSAWVEKQSSVGPAAYKQAREEIEREVAAEAARDAADSQMVYGPVLVDRHLLMDAASTLAACATTATNNTSARAVAAVATQLYKLLGSDVAFAVDESLPEDEATYRLRTVKSWLAAFPELREAITEHMAEDLQRRIQRLAQNTAVEQLAKEMGEFTIQGEDAREDTKPRYMVFRFGDCYPRGGLDDIELRTDDLEEAKRFCVSKPHDNQYVYDRIEDRILDPIPAGLGYTFDGAEWKE